MLVSQKKSSLIFTENSAGLTLTVCGKVYGSVDAEPCLPSPPIRPEIAPVKMPRSSIFFMEMPTSYRPARVLVYATWNRPSPMYCVDVVISIPEIGS